MVLVQVLRFVQDWLPLGWENVARVVGNPGRDTSHVYNWDSGNHVVVMDVPDVVSVHSPEISPEPVKPLPVMVESFPSCVGEPSAGVHVVLDQPVDLAVELVESVPGMSFAIEAVVISEVHGCHIGWMDFS